MTTLSPLTPLTGRTSHNPRFGSAYGMAPPLFKTLDFANPGTSTVGQNKLIYSAVIASRLLKARSINEVYENARRDVLGWYSWFMGSPLMQSALVLSLGLFAPKVKSMLVTSDTKGKGFAEKTWRTFFAPHTLWDIATDKQLEQRQSQLVKAMQKVGHSGKIKETVAMFQKARNYRAVISLMGIAFSCALLGVIVPWLNIVLTGKAVQKKQEQNTH